MPRKTASSVLKKESPRPRIRRNSSNSAALGGRSRFNVHSLAVSVGYRQRLSPIRVLHRFRCGIVRTLRGSHSDREIGLQLVHAGLDFMLLNGIPDIWWPVFIKLLGILDEDYFIGIDSIIASRLAADW